MATLSFSGITDWVKANPMTSAAIGIAVAGATIYAVRKFSHKPTKRITASTQALSGTATRHHHHKRKSTKGKPIHQRIRLLGLK